MPIVGFICPTGVTRTYKQCLLCDSPSCPSKVERMKIIKKQIREDAKTCEDLTRVRISAFSYMCEAKDVLQRQVEYYLPIELAVIFEIGEAEHKEIQSAYPPECCEVEVTRQYDSFKVTGSIDLLYKRELTDIKTCSNFNGIPTFYHKNQLSAYAIYADKLYDKICLRAVNKGSGQNKRYYLKDLTVSENDIIKYTKNVTDYLALKKVKLFFNFNDAICKNCLVKDFCKNFYEVLSMRDLVRSEF